MTDKVLKGKLTLDSSNFEGGAKRAASGLDDLAGKVAKSKGGMDLLGVAMGGVVAGGALALGQKVLGTAMELGEMAAQAEDVERKLTAFAGSAENAAMFADAVAEASNNTVNDMTAMATATSFLQMGLADTTDEMALYVEGATRLGDQTVPAGQRIDAMTQLLKNQSLEMLDNFGLSRAVILARIEELKATENLSREEAFLVAVQEELNRQLGVLGPATDTAAQNLEKMKASTENLKLSLGALVAPTMGEAAGWLYALSEALQGNMGPLQEAATEWKLTYQGIMASQDELAAMNETGATEATRYANSLKDVAEAATAAGAAEKARGKTPGGFVSPGVERVRGSLIGAHAEADREAYRKEIEAAMAAEPIEFAVRFQAEGTSEAAAEGEGGMEAQGRAVAQQLEAGYAQYLGEGGSAGGYAIMFRTAIDADIAKSGDQLKEAGYRLWKAVEPGIQKALKETPWVREFARHMAPYVADILIARGRF